MQYNWISPPSLSLLSFSHQTFIISIQLLLLIVSLKLICFKTPFAFFIFNSRLKIIRIFLYLGGRNSSTIGLNIKALSENPLILALSELWIRIWVDSQSSKIQERDFVEVFTLLLAKESSEFRRYKKPDARLHLKNLVWQTGMPKLELINSAEIFSMLSKKN